VLLASILGALWSGPSARADTDADLRVSQSDAPDPVLVGSDVVYTITIENVPLVPATDATNVMLSDTIPSNATFVSADSADGTCGTPDGGGTLTCDLGTLASGTQATVHVTVTAAVAGLLTNQASAVADQPDPTPDDATSSQETTAQNPAADLSVAQTDAPDPAKVGQNVAYSVVVANGGPQDATGVELVDSLPASSSFVSAVPGQGSCDAPSAGTLSCSLGTISASAQVQVTVTVTPTAVGTIVNQVTVDANEGDPVGSNDTGSESTLIIDPACTIVGTPGDDVLTGTSGNDVICGLAGNDTIQGLAGNDRLDGGLGNDTLDGGDGNDQLFGRDGDDILHGSKGFDLARFDGSAQGVTVDLAAGTATGEGSDTLDGIEGVIGSAHGDTLRGDDHGNDLYGKQGDDLLDGRGGSDYVRYDLATGPVRVRLGSGTASGADGTDTLRHIENVVGSQYADDLGGDADENVLLGRGGDDTIIGWGGFDYASYDLSPLPVVASLTTGRTSGGDGSDSLASIEGLLGSPFADKLEGSGGSNVLSGRWGADELHGRGGRDSVFGNQGADHAFGEKGNDLLAGGPDNDRLDGGKGKDRCLQNGGSGQIKRCESGTHRKKGRGRAALPARLPSRAESP
jgi:uncharacterized repeat protein (TIGR01451 family)